MCNGYVVLVSDGQGHCHAVYYAVSRWEAERVSATIPGSWFTNDIY